MRTSFLTAAIAVVVLSSNALAESSCTKELGTIVEGFATYVEATATRNSVIASGQCLVSPNRRYIALLQREDGNFVVYPMNSIKTQSYLWALASRTTNPGAGILVQRDGHFVSYKAGGITPSSVEGFSGNRSFAVAESNSAKGSFDAYLLAMQDDGNLVLYRGAYPTIKGHAFASFEDAARRRGVIPKRLQYWQCNDSPSGMQCSYR